MKKIKSKAGAMDINEVGLLPEFRNFWNEGQAKGRSWGRKKDGQNPYFGSHFAFIDKNEIVLLVGGRNKRSSLKVFQFQRTDDTVLGKKLLKILSAYDIKPDILV